MVKLIYKLQGKGKNRKREISEILEIIEDKTTYFNNITNNNKDIQINKKKNKKEKKTPIFIVFFIYINKI